jgi:hypothetical protein
MAEQRGVIHYRQRSRQIVNFAGLIYGKITPTDIDGAIDFKNKCAVYIEYKYRDTPIQYGQRIFLERQVQNSNKPAICIVARHNMPQERDIDGAQAVVSEYFTGKAWHVPKSQYTVKRMIDEFVAKHAPECLIL